MGKQDLTQYVFEDGHEQIADRGGRIMAVRDPEVSEDYFPLRKLLGPSVLGSIPTPDSPLNDFARTPRLNEHLLTARFFLGKYVSATLISKINENFELPSSS